MSIYEKALWRYCYAPKNGLYGLGYASDQLIVKIRNKNGIFWTAPLPSPAKWGRGHERQSDCTLCNSTEFAPVSYLSSDVLLQLHHGRKNTGRKSCLPLISLHICPSPVSFHLVLVLALISLCQNNTHFPCLLSWQLSRCCWRKLTSCWLVLVVLVRIASLPIDCSAEEGTVTCWEERVSCTSSWIFRTLVCTLSSCLSMQLFWRLTFPHILQMAAI